MSICLAGAIHFASFPGITVSVRFGLAQLPSSGFTTRIHGYRGAALVYIKPVVLHSREIMLHQELWVLA